jgi:hypothetical protein
MHTGFRQSIGDTTAAPMFKAVGNASRSPKKYYGRNAAIFMSGIVKAG